MNVSIRLKRSQIMNWSFINWWGSWDKKLAMFDMFFLILFSFLFTPKYMGIYGKRKPPSFSWYIESVILMLYSWVNEAELCPENKNLHNLFLVHRSSVALSYWLDVPFGFRCNNLDVDTALIFEKSGVLLTILWHLVFLFYYCW